LPEKNASPQNYAKETETGGNKVLLIKARLDFISE
jgi:hypothetical protein